MPHNTITWLQHMLDSVREAMEMLGDASVRDLQYDRKLQLSIVRLLEVIGEAASRIPAEDRQVLSTVPWKETIALRNRLIHGYDSIDLKIVWGIVHNDLPKLYTELQNQIEKYSEF